MTEKRYYTHKQLLQENKVHDKICHNFMNIDETVEHMNNQYWKYKKLKKENEQLKQRNENQYNQLTEVWGLIHRREWEILIEMDNKMKEDEERLRNEWKCYE